MSSTASIAFITIGFSSRTSSPASRAAVAWAKWNACGVTIMTASSSSARAVTSMNRRQSGSLGGRGPPAASTFAAAAS